MPTGKILDFFQAQKMESRKQEYPMEYIQSHALWWDVHLSWLKETKAVLPQLALSVLSTLSGSLSKLSQAASLCVF